MCGRDVLIALALIPIPILVIFIGLADTNNSSCSSQTFTGTKFPAQRIGLFRYSVGMARTMVCQIVVKWGRLSAILVKSRVKIEERMDSLKGTM